MAFDGDSAEQVVMGSAIVVAGVFAYTAWQGDEQMSLGEFGTAWGVIYLTLALVATVSPPIAAGFALLVMVSDLLVNMPSLSRVIKTGESTSTGTTASSSVQGTLNQTQTQKGSVK
jgi:hypothetical protein